MNASHPGLRFAAVAPRARPAVVPPEGRESSAEGAA